MPRQRCPTRPPAPAPTTPEAMIDGGNRMPTTAPTASARPGAVLGRLLVLVHMDLAVVLGDDRGVIGADQAGRVQILEGLVVGARTRFGGVGGDVEEDGVLGHRHSKRVVGAEGM